MNEAVINAKDPRYVYKIQKIIHEREDENGNKTSVEAIRIAYWKNGKFKQDAPIMLKEEFIPLIEAGTKLKLFEERNLGF